MKKYRISKYNPLFRGNGIYHRNEWTDYSDIGKFFEGELLTLEKYKHVEETYLCCVAELLHFFQIKEMQLTRVEKYEANVPLQNKSTLSELRILDFIKSCLRNKCWGVLQHQNLIIYTGWDFYLHIECDLPYSDVSNIAENYELWVEEWE